MTKRFLIGDFDIETATRRLRRADGEIVHLANRPFQVLLYLVQQRHRLVTRAELLERFWDNRDVYEDALTRCLSTVRKALDDHSGSPRYVETRWAGGYRFVGPCHELDALSPAFISSRNPLLADRLIQRGNAYLSRSGNRRYRYALEMFRQAAGLDPENARAMGGLAASHALLYMHAEPLEEHRAAAISYSRLAVDIDPTCAAAQHARAQVAVMRASHSEAEEAFGMAESIEPSGFHVWYYHGRGCAERNDHEGALARFTRASETDPFDYQALALAEQSFQRLELHADARWAARSCADAADRALRRYPDDFRALSLAACMLPGLGREAEAKGWTERALALEPDEPFVNFNAACVYISLHDYDRALHYLARVPMSAKGNSNWIAQDPSLDPVRDHPRFAALLPGSAA
jgi:DNA-binding winged helix-turn-helix (wHTH) protein